MCSPRRELPPLGWSLHRPARAGNGTRSLSNTSAAPTALEHKEEDKILESQRHGGKRNSPGLGERLSRCPSPILQSRPTRHIRRAPSYGGEVQVKGGGELFRFMKPCRRSMISAPVFPERPVAFAVFPKVKEIPPPPSPLRRPPPWAPLLRPLPRGVVGWRESVGPTHNNPLGPSFFSDRPFCGRGCGMTWTSLGFAPGRACAGEGEVGAAKENCIVTSPSAPLASFVNASRRACTWGGFQGCGTSAGPDSANGAGGVRER